MPCRSVDHRIRTGPSTRDMGGVPRAPLPSPRRPVAATRLASRRLRRIVDPLPSSCSSGIAFNACVAGTARAPSQHRRGAAASSPRRNAAATRPPRRTRIRRRTPSRRTRCTRPGVELPWRMGLDALNMRPMEVHTMESVTWLRPVVALFVLPRPPAAGRRRRRGMRTPAATWTRRTSTWIRAPRNGCVTRTSRAGTARSAVTSGLWCSASPSGAGPRGSAAPPAARAARAWRASRRRRSARRACSASRIPTGTPRASAARAAWLGASPILMPTLGSHPMPTTMPTPAPRSSSPTAASPTTTPRSSVRCAVLRTDGRASSPSPRFRPAALPDSWKR